MLQEATNIAKGFCLLSHHSMFVSSANSIVDLDEDTGSIDKGVADCLATAEVADIVEHILNKVGV